MLGTVKCQCIVFECGALLVNASCLDVYPLAWNIVIMRIPLHINATNTLSHDAYHTKHHCSIRRMPINMDKLAWTIHGTGMTTCLECVSCYKDAV
jgi:hypothetical protein